MVSFKSLNFNTLGYTLFIHCHCDSFYCLIPAHTNILPAWTWKVFKFIIADEELSESTDSTDDQLEVYFHHGLNIHSHIYIQEYLHEYIEIHPNQLSLVYLKSNSMTVVIILQYINISNQHVVHFKLSQCYVPIISQQINKHQNKKKSNSMFVKVSILPINLLWMWKLILQTLSYLMFFSPPINLSISKGSYTCDDL